MTSAAAATLRATAFSLLAAIGAAQQQAVPLDAPPPSSRAAVGRLALAGAAGLAAGVAIGGFRQGQRPAKRTHSLADQVARFERAKAEGNTRFLDMCAAACLWLAADCVV